MKHSSILLFIQEITLSGPPKKSDSFKTRNNRKRKTILMGHSQDDVFNIIHSNIGL